MALEDYRSDMEMCCRCSICKFIPLEKLTENRHSYVCPSIARFNFQCLLPAAAEWLSAFPCWKRELIIRINCWM